MNRAILVCLALLSLSTPTVAAEKAKRLPIVDKAIAHHGGDLYRASETSLTIRSRSGAFRLTSRMDGDRFDHTVTDTPEGGKERRTRATNDAVERWEGGQKATLDGEGERRARDFVMSRVYFPFLPYRLNDPSVYKEDLGLVDWEGRKLHKVKVTFEAGTSTDANDEYLYWFDPETGRVEQLAYSFGTGRERGGLRFRQSTNFRRIGGILFYDAENFGIDGGGDLKIDSITPEAVKSWKKISTVTLEGIEVKPLK
jgi:hypothetical protein